MNVRAPMDPTSDEPADVPPAPAEPLGRDASLGLYRTMSFVRRFEEVAQALFLRGQISGSIHLCMGQEAVATGVCDVLQAEDLVAATYRGHGQALALGTDPTGLMSELLGRRTGTCGGRAGSMNIVDLEHRLIGCFGIVGGSIAAATGAALALKKRGSAVAVAFFGDGAANQGYFHECLNFAAVNRLPVVYVCENNLYGEFTPMQAVTAGGILPRPRALGIASATVDGNDVWAVREAAAWATSRARGGDGPVFLQMLTYRYNDHARGDPVNYRPDGEMEAWRARDPLTIARARLVADHGASEDELDLVVSKVAGEVERVRELALQQPLPDPNIRGSEFKEMGEVHTDA